jgi:hypothetical protein
MASVLAIDEVDKLNLDFNKVTFDDHINVKEYEIIKNDENIEDDFVLVEGGDTVVLSDSEDEGPLVAPRNATSGDDRAHTPQKISKITRRRASPLSRSNITVVHHQGDSNSNSVRPRRKKKLGRRKQRIYENNHLLNSHAFWKTFGEDIGDCDYNIDFLNGFDNLGISFSKKDGGFKELLKNPELLEVSKSILFFCIIQNSSQFPPPFKFLNFSNKMYYLVCFTSQDFLACKTFKSNSKKKPNGKKKRKNSKKTTAKHHIHFEDLEHLETRSRYGSY